MELQYVMQEEYAREEEEEGPARASSQYPSSSEDDDDEGEDKVILSIRYMLCRSKLCPPAALTLQGLS